jgi:hypothetical protein
MERPEPPDQVGIDGSGPSPTSSRRDTGPKPYQGQDLVGAHLEAFSSHRGRRGDTVLHGELGEGRVNRSKRREKDLRDGHGEVHFGARRGLTPASLGQKKGQG